MDYEVLIMACGTLSGSTLECRPSRIGSMLECRQQTAVAVCSSAEWESGAAREASVDGEGEGGGGEGGARASSVRVERTITSIHLTSRRVSWPTKNA